MITMRPIYFGGYRTGYCIDDWRNIPATIQGEFHEFLDAAITPDIYAERTQTIIELEREVRYLRQDLDDIRERATRAEAKLTEIYKIVST